MNILKKNLRPDCMECLQKGFIQCKTCGGFNAAKNHFPNTIEYLLKNGYINHFDMLTSKQPFPYSWLTDYDQIFQKEFVTKSDFYDTLKGQHISDEDYLHAKNVYEKLEMTCFGDYLKLYQVRSEKKVFFLTPM